MKRPASKLLLMSLKAIIQQPKIIQMVFFWLPFLGGVLLIVGGGWYFYETKVQQPKMTYMGVPFTQNNFANLTHTLRNEGYMVGYSEKLANPLWVIYKVINTKQKFGKRPKFKKDWRSLAGITTYDYKGSGYTRGHLAPNYVIASRYGKKAQKETFLMTNISPQKAAFNQKIWQRLEEVSANHFSNKFDTFWVVTGPIFDKNPTQLKNTEIAIPKAFYKIFITPKTDNHPVQALAFIIPQNAGKKDNLLNYVTTIDEVEKQTNIDFFWRLEKEVEDNVESLIAYQAWELQKVANLPNRY